MSTRPNDWPNRLSDFLKARDRVPFQWGKQDCCIFTCDWLLALTGDDPAKDLRGTYDSALSAARVLKERGGVLAIAKDACATRGWDEIPVSRAGRGDVVTKDMDQSPALGVCAGERSAFPGPKGIIYHPTLSCARAWRIS